jgi:hypothetical protein
LTPHTDRRWLGLANTASYCDEGLLLCSAERRKLREILAGSPHHERKKQGLALLFLFAKIAPLVRSLQLERSGGLGHRLRDALSHRKSM